MCRPGGSERCALQPAQAQRQQPGLPAVGQHLRESCRVMCSRNSIQSRPVSSQVRNYRERRNFGVCLFIWSKRAVSAIIGCQMENVGWEALKKENSPRRKQSSVPQYKINRSQTSSKLLSSFKPDFLQILEKLLCIIPKSPLGSRAARHKPVCIGTSYQITALPRHSNLPWRSTWCWPLGWAHHGADPVTPVPKALASTQRRWTWNKASPCSSAGHASKMNNQLQKTFCFSEDKHGVQLHTATSISLSSFPQFELYLLIISDTSMPYLQLVKNIVIFWNTVLLLQWMCQHCCQTCFNAMLQIQLTA